MTAPRPHAEFVLLGTGCSTCIPNLHHVLRDTGCPVCADVKANPLSKNRRNCVCALFRVGMRTVLVDCGKTIRDSALRYFPSLGVRQVNAVVLTHGHLDAMGGCDELRELQNRNDGPTPLFLSEKTKGDFESAYGFMAKGNNPRVALNVFDKFTAFEPLPGEDLQFHSVPLLHGGSYVCHGFVIVYRHQGRTTTIAYLSDVHEVPDETLSFLQSFAIIDLLVIDALISEITWSHFGLGDARKLAQNLKPVTTRCVGMHCSLGLHDDIENDMRRWRHKYQLDFLPSYDGERFPL